MARFRLIGQPPVLGCDRSGPRSGSPESPSKFYAPIIEWIDKHGDKLNGATVNFKVDYFNTPSARVLREVLDQFQKLYNKGIKITVNWYFDDESSKEEFEYEFAQGLTIPINFLEKK